MGTQFLSKEALDDFYSKYESSSTVLTLFLMAATCGLYAINWMYMRNRAFEKIDENAPDSKRGAVLTLAMPLVWIYIAWVLDNSFLENSQLFALVKIIGWLTIMLLVLKYVYDFCICFSRFTRSNELIWYYGLFPGLIFYVLVPLTIWYESVYIWYTYPFLFFMIIAISAMQAKLNAEKNLFEIKEGEGEFYKRGRIG